VIVQKISLEKNANIKFLVLPILVRIQEFVKILEILKVISVNVQEVILVLIASLKCRASRVLVTTEPALVMKITMVTLVHAQKTRLDPTVP
jgi:hypothetical protein